MNEKLNVVFGLVSFFLFSFLAKFISEFSHEFLGHCLFSIITGGGYLAYYVSWIWPLKFGYAYTYSNSYISEILIISGGIIVCLSISLLVNILIYFFLKIRTLQKLYYAVLIHFSFWLGFWAFVNSVGYLLIGALINFGDIRNLSNATGIENWIFIFPGLIFFLILFYFISVNFYQLFAPFLRIKEEFLVSIFWLLIPVIYILFYFNPQINLKISFFFLGLIIMFLPSIFTFLTLRFKTKLWNRIYTFKDNFPNQKIDNIL